MASNVREITLANNVQQKQKATTLNHVENNDDNSNIAVSPSISALTNADPSVSATIFEPSKIKNFIYKVEPNIAKVDSPSLALICTTAALFLKTLVEKSVLRQQEDTHTEMCKMKGSTGHRHSDRAHNQNNFKSIDGSNDHCLITSNHLKQFVSSSDSSSLDFLEEAFENFRDKDGSMLPSRLQIYAPRKSKSKNDRAMKRSAAQIAREARTKTVLQCDYCEERNSGNSEKKNKRLKSNPISKDTSSFLPLTKSNSHGNSDPIDKVITNAAYADENPAFGKIILDDDDYD